MPHHQLSIPTGRLGARIFDATYVAGKATASSVGWDPKVWEWRVSEKKRKEAEEKKKKEEAAKRAMRLLTGKGAQKKPANSMQV